MKKRFLTVTIALATVAILSLAGYFILGIGSDPGNQALPRIQDADVIYTNAATAIQDAEDVVLTISTTLETTVNDAVFLEISQQTLSYLGLGTEAMRASVEETLTVASHSVDISETFVANTAYTTIEGSRFSSQISAKDYQARFAPTILLDAKLYASITGIDTGDNYVISFQQPSQAEHWAMDEGCVFLNAVGTAYVSHDGQLTKSVYAVNYARGNVRFRRTVIVEAALATTSIEAPADASAYVPVQYLDGARMLERASGYLLQSDNVSAHYRDRIYFQAFGDERTQMITVNTHKGDRWFARVDTDVTLKNDSHVGQESRLNKSERFLYNTYSVSTDGGEPVEDPGINADDMKTYCQNLLVGTVMLPQYITDSQIDESENTLRVTFSANEAFAQLIRKNVCQTLYQDPQLLNEQTQDNTTDKLECYLELDRESLLPVAAGICYEGTYAVEGLPCPLSFQADQTYDIASKIADKAIGS